MQFAVGAVCVLAFASLVVVNDALTITNICHPYASSHTFLGSKFGQELSSRGHKYRMVVSESDIPVAIERTKGSKIEIVTYASTTTKKEWDDVVSHAMRTDELQATYYILETISNECRNIFKNQTLLNIIKADTDVILVDTASPCSTMLADYLGPNVVRVDYSPIGFYDPFTTAHWGIPQTLSYVPMIGTSLSNKMSFGDRLKNVIQYSILYLVGMKIDATIDEVRKEINSPNTHANSCRSNTMYLVPVDWPLEYARPISPNTKMIGGLLAGPAKPLPEGLQAWLDTAKQGVVVVSLGTVAVLTEEKIKVLAAGFGKLPYQVLWSVKNFDHLEYPSNVKISNWLPLNDVLAHKNVKAFVSHCGMNSLQEGAYHGVPIVALPQCYDQFNNAAKAQAKGIAVVLDQNALTPESVSATVNQVIDSPQYKQAAQRLSIILRDRTRSPVQEGADWIEYAHRMNGTEFLRIDSLDKSIVEFYCLDVLAAIFGFLIVFFWILSKICKCICCCGKSSKTKKEKTN